MAQKEDPNKGDFCKLVEDDIKTLEIDLNEEEYENSTKNTLKKIVKKAAKAAAYKYLLNEMKYKSKMKV